MPEPVLFQELRPETKVDFFVKCQEILKNHHPESPFAFTTNNFNDRKDYFKSFYERYKGFAYTEENVCILFNRIFLKDALNPVEAVKTHQWKGPEENYNAVMIDFVAFRQMEDCLSFCRNQYNEKIKYILFARNNDIKVYETDKLLKKLSVSQAFQFPH